VMGADDSIILSRASLMLGVAVTRGNGTNLLIAGTTGLVAGAMSIAAGRIIFCSFAGGCRAGRSGARAK